ncbi:PREDICTED: centrosomal protein CEP57L1 isoform X2 [Cyprinodon variegatus]|uniref:centrosomal protein CEP57L1 isoform X2 n=1 Tax=Cyprinodon variegatus TaxID=28743 RepID=UPI000742C0ED|nr:PREDICTED: centrosomal protein CEP57L1 isoform X2 [Cyprinodon variegatus]
MEGTLISADCSLGVDQTCSRTPLFFLLFLFFFFYFDLTDSVLPRRRWQHIFSLCYRMETHHDKILDSPSKNSYIGSYYQPPDRILSVSKHQEFPALSPLNMDQTSRRLSQTTCGIDSKAVVDALKTLQEKIRRLELERKQAERSYAQFSQDSPKHQQDMASHSRTEANLSGSALDLKLQSAEARCKVLEKQLDYMRKMVENVKKERHVLMGNESQQPSSSNNQNQREKLEKLESEYLKLSRTQTMAEMKLAILEQKLLKEEHERKLVQEKAEELRRELDVNLHLTLPPTEDTRQKKTKKTNQKTSKQDELPSGSPRHKKMPFVIGTSTSPSHSVHANVQSILHMMKHHHPQLCERVISLQRPGCGVKKNLQNEFSDSAPQSDSPPADQSLTLLSDLLLALQDELGQMSFEYQELEHQIEANQDDEHREDLQRELERLSAKMEEKGAQITKLRKHQQTVQKLSQRQQRTEDQSVRKVTGIEPPVPSPVKAKQKTGRKGAASHNNLQLLRETKKFRSSLKQDDVSWET